MSNKYVILGLLISALLLVTNAGYIHAKAILAQFLIKDAWSETLETGQPTKPWSWADTWPVAKLSVADIGIEQYVLSGATGAPLAFGPGVNLATVLPGEVGLTMIAGHRDTHFAFLEDIKVSQQLTIEDRFGQSHSYTVSSIQIRDSREGMLDIDSSKDQIVLVTCYPFNAINPGGPLRYLVTATRKSS